MASHCDDCDIAVKKLILPELTTNCRKCNKVIGSEDNCHHYYVIFHKINLKAEYMGGICNDCLNMNYIQCKDPIYDERGIFGYHCRQVLVKSANKKVN